MADRVLFISWTNAVRGAEVRAVEAFNEAIWLVRADAAEGSDRELRRRVDGAE